MGGPDIEGMPASKIASDAMSKPSPTRGDSKTMRGTVEVAPANTAGERGKHFSGIFFVTSEKRFVVSYSRDDVFSLLGGKEVIFDGMPYVPQHQALMADHLRPGGVALQNPTNEDLFTAIGAAERVCGELLTSIVPPGQKASGEKRRKILVGDASFNYRSLGEHKNGLYEGSMRRIKVNAEFAPKLPMTMSMPGNLVWLANLESVPRCPK